MNRANAYWIVGEQRGELRAENLSPPAAGEVQVQALHSTVSRGSELLVFRGGVPVSERSRMRAPHQAGEFPWPVKYGYSSVGRVSESDAALLGQTVFCLYPHQDAYVVPRDAVIALPNGLPPARAVLAANMETALNAIWDSGLCAGDRVIVIGAGVVGLLVAYLAAGHPGTRVTVVDIDARKQASARALGLGFATPAEVAPGAQIVFHASGQPVGLQSALSLAAPEGAVVELSWYGDRAVSLPLGEAFHSRRLRLISSQVGELAAARRAHFSRRQRLALALELLLDDRLDTLLCDGIAFADLPAAMTRLASSDDATLALRVDYESARRRPE